MNAIAKPQGCTNFRLRHLARQVSRHYDAEVAHSGLKTSQYSLLSHVMHLGPIRPGELAKAMGVDASTLTRNLKPMVAAGWLTQGEGSDARSRLVEITEAGRSKRAEAQRHWRTAQEKLNALLGIDRVLALHALVDESIALLSGPDETTEGERDE
ncbi:MarR family winged helix-turn-helix transcriptional regulator [Variovorax sp. J31P207]|uniref:MarR family winged helix-turn-helix transcriptional regulator n=1 Tax=Variovorax sp. J31P207 TaxID=3053510 RepID=UPI002578E345|nr:MarR family winged helix-turn-helix transcriptional regulator [Variovorax sp. J31P207]MDM0068270.1 MarR family winged helix-turn-helix transcriptional regulator [Variovorax sp. J31P207]